MMLFILLCLLFVSLTFAKPISVDDIGALNLEYPIPLEVAHSVSSPLVQGRATTPLSLSILPIGDSITVGVCSTDGNGYRLDLKNLLENGGFKSDFIGTQTSGDDNSDNQHEGYGWNRIYMVLDKMRADGIIRQQPNLVLLHIGTNDNDAETKDDNEVVTESYADAPTRLAQMVDYVLCNDPNAVVLVAKLIRNDYNQTQTDYFNTHVPDIVGQRYMKGYKIRLVDMSNLGYGERCDQLHPTDLGYEHMAEVWYEAIRSVPADWWTLSDSPSPAVGGKVETCARNAISFSPALDGNVAPGFHVDGDTPEPPAGPGNTFSPAFGPENVIALGVALPQQVQFVDLNGDGMADYLLTDSDDGSVRAWINDGDNNYQPVNNGDKIAFGTGTSSFVEFADLDGDKRPEYIVVSNGEFHVWRNEGQDGTIWQWSPFPAAAQHIMNIFPGGSAGFHFFGDMNGDGLADVCVVNPNGVLDFYIQQGQIGSDSFSWKQCLNAGIFVKGMMLVDIDGDGRADYLADDGNGGIKGWLNKPGGSCGITWVSINDGGAIAIATSSGYTAAFADIDGDGKADYLKIEGDGGVVRLFPNTGTNHAPETSGLGGFGAAVRLADMNGDGRDDYLSVGANTYVVLDTNGGQSGGEWVWDDRGLIGYQDTSTTSRSEIQFADMNGDGFDDFLIVDKQTGAIKCYLNNPSPDGTSIQYQDVGVIAIGVGGTGTNVRLADMNGDGRADYIYLDKGGAARVWLNMGPGDDLSTWQVLNGGAADAIGVGAESADVQFHDVDGDGLADYLWIHPDTGAVDVYYNDGEASWTHGGQIIAGVGVSGAHVRFARIGTSGRADYVTVEEDSGALKAWLSQCSEVIGTRGSGSCAGPPLPTKSAPEPVPTPDPIDYDGPSDWENDNDGDGYNDNYDPTSDPPVCDYSLNFANLDDVYNSDAANSNTECVGFYALQALIAMFDTAYANYTSVDDGYDTEFGYYVTYITKLVPDVLSRSLMFNGTNLDKGSWLTLPTGPCMKYFDCLIDGDDTSFACTDEELGSHDEEMWTDPTTLTLRDSDGFDTSLVDAGMLQDWVVFGDFTQERIVSAPGASRKFTYKFHQFPVASDSMVVPNPKDIITKGLGDMPALKRAMQATLLEILMGQWVGGTPEDAALVYSTPVFMLMQAVDGMAQAKTLGAKEEQKEKKEEEERKKNFILLIVSVVLFFVPVIGEEAAAAAGLATLARTIAIAGEIGNTALAIYDTVNDPSSAIINILGQLFGVGAITKATRDGVGLAKIAKIRRGMSADEVATLGKLFADNDTTLKKVLSAACKA